MQSPLRITNRKNNKRDRTYARRRSTGSSEVPDVKKPKTTTQNEKARKQAPILLRLLPSATGSHLANPSAAQDRGAAPPRLQE